MTKKLDSATEDKILDLLEQGKKPCDVARACAVSYNTVYALKKKNSKTLDNQSVDPLNDSSSSLNVPSPANSSERSPLGLKAGRSSRDAALKLAKRNKLNADNLARVRKLRTRVNKLLDAPDCGASPGQSVASALKALIDAVESLHELELAAHGLEAGAAAVEQRIVEVPAPVSVEQWQAGQALAISGTRPGDPNNPDPRRN